MAKKPSRRSNYNREIGVGTVLAQKALQAHSAFPNPAYTYAPFSPNAYSGTATPAQSAFIQGKPWTGGGRPAKTGEYSQGRQRRDVRTGKIKGITRTGSTAAAQQNARTGAIEQNQRYGHRYSHRDGLSRRGASRVVEAQKAGQAYHDATKRGGSAASRAVSTAQNRTHRMWDRGGNIARGAARVMNNPLTQAYFRSAGALGTMMSPIINTATAMDTAVNGPTLPSTISAMIGGPAGVGAYGVGMLGHSLKELSKNHLSHPSSPFSENFDPYYRLSPEAWDTWYKASIGNGFNPTVTKNYYDLATGGWRINNAEPWKHVQVRDGKVYLPVGAPMENTGDGSGRNIAAEYNRKMPYKEVPMNILRKVDRKYLPAIISDMIPVEIPNTMLPELEVTAKRRPTRSRRAVQQPAPVHRSLQGIVAPPVFNLPMQSPRYDLPQQQVAVSEANPWINNNLHSYDGTNELQSPGTSWEVAPRPGTYEYQVGQDMGFYALGYNPFRIR